MPGTVKIWWHDGGVRDVRYNTIPVVNEPELGFQSISVGAAPVASASAPVDAVVALVECDVPVRYVVREQGGTTDADPVASKPINTTGYSVISIGIPRRGSISFVEA